MYKLAWLEDPAVSILVCNVMCVPAIGLSENETLTGAEVTLFCAMESSLFELETSSCALVTSSHAPVMRSQEPMVLHQKAAVCYNILGMKLWHS